MAPRSRTRRATRPSIHPSIHLGGAPRGGSGPSWAECGHRGGGDPTLPTPPHPRPQHERQLGTPGAGTLSRPLLRTARGRTRMEDTGGGGLQPSRIPRSPSGRTCPGRPRAGGDLGPGLAPHRTAPRRMARAGHAWAATPPAWSRSRCPAEPRCRRRGRRGADCQPRTDRPRGASASPCPRPARPPGEGGEEEDEDAAPGAARGQRGPGGAGRVSASLAAPRLRGPARPGVRDSCPPPAPQLTGLPGPRPLQQPLRGAHVLRLHRLHQLLLLPHGAAPMRRGDAAAAPRSAAAAPRPRPHLPAARRPAPSSGSAGLGLPAPRGRGARHGRGAARRRGRGT